jgi:hypothetical protein
MRVTRRHVTFGGLGLPASAAMGGTSRAELGELLNIGEGLEDFWLATDAYIYGYPLVTMEYTRRVMTNVAMPEGTRAPMGQFVRARQYPTAAFRDVTAPNADTLSMRPTRARRARAPRHVVEAVPDAVGASDAG